MNWVNFIFIIVCLTEMSQCSKDTDQLPDPPRGHMQPFGSHTDSSDTTEELNYVPHSLQFYEKYVKTQTPVIFRGALNQSRVLRIWTNEYLKEHYGNLPVLIQSDGLAGRTTVNKYIDHYQDADGSVMSTVPKPMEKDLPIPPCLLCGTFTEGIQNVELLWSGANARSIVHQHSYEELQCVIKGTVRMVFIQPNQTHLLYLSGESLKEFRGESVIDVDAVDLLKYPKIQQVKYSSVAVNEGDCFYLPHGYSHQFVINDAELTLAYSIWFSFFTKSRPFEGSHCDKELQMKAVSDVDVLWTFDGSADGDLQMEHMDIHVLRTVLLTSGDGNGLIFLDKFTNHFFNSDTVKQKNEEDDIRRQFCDILDPTGRGYVTVKEVKALSIDTLKKLLLKFDPTDVLNTVDLEYSIINAEVITNVVTYLATVGPDPGFHANELIDAYVQQLGGTREKAQEILAGLGAHEDELVTMEMVNEKLEKAITKFRNARPNEPANHRLWFKHLIQHNEI